MEKKNDDLLSKYINYDNPMSVNDILKFASLQGLTLDDLIGKFDSDAVIAKREDKNLMDRFKILSPGRQEKVLNYVDQLMGCQNISDFVEAKVGACKRKERSEK